jgi:ABC-2 type transport system ATP-binding protein
LSSRNRSTVSIVVEEPLDNGSIGRRTPKATFGLVGEAPPLVCRGVSKTFGAIRALNDVSLEVPAGSITGFLGPNGAGKSTLLRIVSGLLRPSAGQVELFGVDARTPAARAALGAMPADPVFYTALTGRENLDLLASLQHAEPVGRAHACEVLDLPDDVLDRPSGTYSSGMRQKLGIVQAVQHAPALVVLDEPANRLDPLAHHAFETLMREVVADGRSVLLSSHTLSEVQELCDRIVMVQRGRVLLASGSEELMARARRLLTVHFDGAAPPTLPAEVADVTVIERGVVTGRMPASRPDLLRNVLDAPGVVDVLVEPARLEDIFLDLYADDASAS